MKQEKKQQLEIIFPISWEELNSEGLRNEQNKIWIAKGANQRKFGSYKMPRINHLTGINTNIPKKK